jgi:hypothetical protein
MDNRPSHNSADYLLTPELFKGFNDQLIGALRRERAWVCAHDTLADAGERAKPQDAEYHDELQDEE